MNLVEANLAIVPIAVFILTAIAVFTDLKSRKIPNWLTVSAFVTALGFHYYAGGISGLLQSIAGFATGFGLLLVLWLIGGGGGGDVKLMGAIGAWVGPTLTLIIFITSTLCAVLCVVGIITWRVMFSTGKSESSSKKSSNPMQGSPDGSPMQNAVPYAVPAALASWAVVLLQFI